MRRNENRMDDCDSGIWEVEESSSIWWFFNMSFFELFDIVIMFIFWFNKFLKYW